MKTLKNENLKVWEKYGKTRYYINNVTGDVPCFIDVVDGIATLVFKPQYRGIGIEENFAWDRLEDVLGEKLVNAFMGDMKISVEKLEELA